MEINQENIVLMKEDEISLALTRMAYQIIEGNYPFNKNVALIGIKRGGGFIAQRFQKIIYDITNCELDLGFIDISLYRDDLVNVTSDPVLSGTEIDFNILGRRIVLIDDIFFTGRTVRAALDALIDFGRPEVVKLAVLVDRHKGEYPIHPDYYGRKVDSPRENLVKMSFKENGVEDIVYEIKK